MGILFEVLRIVFCIAYKALHVMVNVGMINIIIIIIIIRFPFNHIFTSV